MNRIILIGNGFDKAHNLETGYEDFIKWYWRKWGNVLLASANKLEEDRLCLFKLAGHISLSGWSFALLRYKINTKDPDAGLKAIERVKFNRALCDSPFKNSFFQTICEGVETKKWVDIENVYYDFLKKSDDPKQLNDDLDFIRYKLVEYLSSLTELSLNPIVRHQILEPIAKEDFAIESKDQWTEMLKARINYGEFGWKSLVDVYNAAYGKPRYSATTIYQFCLKHRENIFAVDDFNTQCPGFLLPDKIMLLNFNYTNTADLYLPDVYRFSVNHIHGSLSNPESVIFGYGDERDDEYQPLMKKNDNEYLRHIKSFRYLESSNYRRMREFLELGPYQVCIMGHSCGISDRTLLSTLFEHKNCVSIKPYYRLKEDGTDNYFDLVCNIARSISDPRLMRDRVVRKEHCQPLGQLSPNNQNQ